MEVEFFDADRRTWSQQSLFRFMKASNNDFHSYVLNSPSTYSLYILPYVLKMFRAA
jgi:hypothetical protein